MEQMYAGVKMLIDSTETVLRGDVTWYISPLEEKFTGLRCDPDFWEDCPEVGVKYSMGIKDIIAPEGVEAKGLHRVYDSGHDPEQWTLKGLHREGVKTFIGQDGIKYHIQAKGMSGHIYDPGHCPELIKLSAEDKDTLVRGIKTGSIDSEQWI